MRIKVVHPPRGARRGARRRTLVPGRANELVVLIAEYCCCASVSLGRGARYGDVRDQREHGPVVCARRCSTVSVVAVQFACGVARGTARRRTRGWHFAARKHLRHSRQDSSPPGPRQRSKGKQPHTEDQHQNSTSRCTPQGTAAAVDSPRTQCGLCSGSEYHFPGSPRAPWHGSQPGQGRRRPRVVWLRHPSPVVHVVSCVHRAMRGGGNASHLADEEKLDVRVRGAPAGEQHLELRPDVTHCGVASPAEPILSLACWPELALLHFYARALSHSRCLQPSTLTNILSTPRRHGIFSRRFGHEPGAEPAPEAPFAAAKTAPRRPECSRRLKSAGSSSQSRDLATAHASINGTAALRRATQSGIALVTETLGDLWPIPGREATPNP